MDTFVCKVLVVANKNSRILKPMVIDDSKNNVPKSSRSLKKCLFGSPDPVETEKMVREQQEVGRKRFLETYGIDLKAIEESERESNAENLGGGGRRRVLKGKRKVLEERQSQTIMTDFYQSRKTVQSTKSLKDAKEN